jgi:rhamnulokinase
LKRQFWIIRSTAWNNILPIRNYIAIDLGAESGRIMLATLPTSSERCVSLTEIHRFTNTPIQRPDGLHWDLPRIESEIIVGLEKAKKAANGPIAGISTDSWGVDYVLIGPEGMPRSLPFIYRDPRQAEPFRTLTESPGREFIFMNTGIQLMAINTLYQLYAESKEALSSSRGFLFIADYVNHLLCGRPGALKVEASLASTSQAMDVQGRDWSDALIERVRLPRSLFPEIFDSGTILGDSVHFPGAKVVASCSHDTACAVAAVPASADSSWAYISSGTWSLAGVELPNPIVTQRCLELGFSNELGLGGKVRLLKNISGLYILQQCRAAWSNQGNDWDYETLANEARRMPAFSSLIRPDAARFAQPGDMPTRIADYCRETAQPIPRTPAEFVRCIYESLALLYRQTLADLRELTSQSISVLHIVGGGSRSDLLNQLTASACEIPVYAGPVEATSLGNVLVQACALGDLDVNQIRNVVRESVSPTRYEPQHDPLLNSAIDRFMKLPISN